MNTLNAEMNRILDIKPHFLSRMNQRVGPTSSRAQPEVQSWRGADAETGGVE